MLKIKKVKKFDGVGNPTSFRMIKENLVPEANFAVELSESQKIIKLNVPFSEIYHKCTIGEWSEIKNIINSLSKKP